jgi:adenine-specific DNA-methyltransferase
VSTERGTDLVEQIDLFRVDATRNLDPATRSSLGQFLTPPAVARFMAALFHGPSEDLRVLDAGAGVGSLTAAFVDNLCAREKKPRSINATAYELDPALCSYVRTTLEECRSRCRASLVQFSSAIEQVDFIKASVETLDAGLFSSKRRSFNCAILNPPYKKIQSSSDARLLLRRIGVETSNLYTGFLALAVRLLDEGGELVAITPRSFCNGPYFQPFREMFLDAMSIKHVHVYESRSEAFGDDEVLQENVIFHAVKGAPRDRVTITAGAGPSDDWISVRTIAYDELVRPDDPERFIHVVPDEVGRVVSEQMRSLDASLHDLGTSVSTGRVVDFRAREHLRMEPAPGTVPLIYPTHFADGRVDWPKEGKKPNAILENGATDELLLPAGAYVLVKRFSAKEERRRVVAAVYDPRRVKAERVAFENHLNVYHCASRGLSPDLARGLAAFLNTTLVDDYFRQFSGHTQVNATDLRKLHYPQRGVLEAIGAKIGDNVLDQAALDRLVYEELPRVATSGVKPVRGRGRVEEAQQILAALELPAKQLNERSALTLLALVGMKPNGKWAHADNPLRGITPMMEFFAEHYGKTYAPNSRETVRRQTVHQFLEAGLIIENPDDPERPTNSGKTVYQIEHDALWLIKSFKTDKWDKRLSEYLASRQTLRERYARERAMKRIPVQLPGGSTISLSPGGQNVLIKAIIDEFCPRFAPGGKVLYVGDTDDKWACCDEEAFRALDVGIDRHGKMPDVIVHHVAKNWLLLIEAVTSHGPVNPKRHDELRRLFSGAKAGLVYVTTFLSRAAMAKYVSEISWETEVWVAESPSHMVHFNGERFLGPHGAADGG